MFAIVRSASERCPSGYLELLNHKRDDQGIRRTAAIHQPGTSLV